MAQRVIIIHGTEGSPEENWFPSLREEVQKRDLECLCPQFPTPEGQNLDAWRECMAEHVGELQPEDILVGHSTGAIFALHAAQERAQGVGGIVLVAGFLSPLGIPHYDNLNRTFFEEKLNKTEVRKSAKSFFVFAGDDDPYVPKEHTEELAATSHQPSTAPPYVVNLLCHFEKSDLAVLQHTPAPDFCLMKKENKECLQKCACSFTHELLETIT